MPDNRQIDTVLEYAIEHSPVDLKQLSSDGRTLIEDSRCVAFRLMDLSSWSRRDILETLRMMVLEKNDDELLQNAVFSSYSGDASRAKQDGVLPVGKEKVNEDAKQGEHNGMLF